MLNHQRVLNQQLDNARCYLHQHRGEAACKHTAEQEQPNRRVPSVREQLTGRPELPSRCARAACQGNVPQDRVPRRWSIAKRQVQHGDSSRSPVETSAEQSMRTRWNAPCGPCPPALTVALSHWRPRPIASLRWRTHVNCMHAPQSRTAGPGSMHSTGAAQCHPT